MPVTLHRMQQGVKAAALCASQDPDSLEQMPAPTKSRGHAIPKVEWWCALATEAAAPYSHVELAALLLERFGYEVSSTSVGRTLNGDVLTIETARHLSDLFGLPPPVIIPSSEEEALVLLGAQQREQVRAQLGVIRAGVERGELGGQPSPVRSTKDGRPRTKR